MGNALSEVRSARLPGDASTRRFEFLSQSLHRFLILKISFGFFSLFVLYHTPIW